MKTNVVIVSMALAMALPFAVDNGGRAFAAKVIIPRAPITLKQAPQGPPPPSYRFTIESFNILDTRSAHNDTDYVTAGLTGKANQVKDMGDVNNGTHNVGLYFDEGVAPLDVVTLNYVIVNSGKDPDALGKYFANFGFNIGVLFGQNWGGILPGGCDGVVADGKHTFTGKQLADGTAGGQSLSGNDFTPGTDSADGCGSNSRYYVRWDVKAIQ